MLVCMDPLANLIPNRGGELKWEKPPSHRVRVELEGPEGHQWVDLMEENGKLVLMACEPIAVHPLAANHVEVRVVGFGH